jgi:hypothetical protein
MSLTISPLHSEDKQGSEAAETEPAIVAKTDSASFRHGSCLCQAILYELADEAFRRVLCHCVECKKATRSAFIANN